MNHLYLLLQILILMGFSQNSYGEAQSVGTLRIIVLENNPQHQTPVSLILNGRNVLSFSHATVGAQNLSITKDVLANGKQTGVKADYGRLQQGCQFDFEVSFSKNPNTWISLGRFHAPTSGGSVYIPLGLCNGNELCSSDINIQKTLDRQKAEEAERDRRNIQALRDWLQKGIDDDARKKQELVAKSKSNVQTKTSFEEHESFDEEIEQIEDKIQNENVSTSNEPAYEKVQTWNDDELLALIGPMVSEIPDQMKSIMREMGCFDKDYLWKFAQFEAVAGLFLHVSAEGRDFLTNEEIALLERVSGQEFKNYILNYQISIIEQVRFTKYFNQVKDLAAIGIRFSPFGDLVDFCEMATGRENCNSDGALLSKNQRFIAALGIVVGNRKVNNFVADELKALLREAEGVFDSSGKIQWSRVFSEVESGSLVRHNKTELIEQLRKDKNIPKDWKVVLSKEKDGLVYSHPTKPEFDDVRIMSGNSQNPNRISQSPYVRYKRNGQWLDKFGNVVSDKYHPDGHIPIDEFKFPIGEN